MRCRTAQGGYSGQPGPARAGPGAQEGGDTPNVAAHFNLADLLCVHTFIPLKHV
jgi:hypothetical protein